MLDKLLRYTIAATTIVYGLLAAILFFAFFHGFDFHDLGISAIGASWCAYSYRRWWPKGWKP